MPKFVSFWTICCFCSVVQTKMGNIRNRNIRKMLKANHFFWIQPILHYTWINIFTYILQFSAQSSFIYRVYFFRATILFVWNYMYDMRFITFLLKHNIFKSQKNKDKTYRKRRKNWFTDCNKIYLHIYSYFGKLLVILKEVVNLLGAFMCKSAPKLVFNIFWELIASYMQSSQQSNSWPNPHDNKRI